LDPSVTASHASRLAASSSVAERKLGRIKRRGVDARRLVLAGTSRGFSAVNIREFVLKATRLPDLVELRRLSPRAAASCDASVRAGLNVLIGAAPKGPPFRDIEGAKRCCGLELVKCLKTFLLTLGCGSLCAGGCFSGGILSLGQ